MYMLITLVLAIAYWTRISSIENVTCETVWGNQVSSNIASVVSCNNDYTLTSCGIFAYNTQRTLELEGTFIDANNRCFAASQSDATAAVARCCKFPNTLTQPICTNHKNVTKDISTVKCGDENSVLTGCGVLDLNYDFMGGYAAGQTSITDFLNQNFTQFTLLETNNTCNAHSYYSNSILDHIESNAQCCNMQQSGYKLECYAFWVYQTGEAQTGRHSCPNGYFMTACNAMSASPGTLDAYYVTDDNKCDTQMDNHEPLYSQSICCQLVMINATDTTSNNPTSSPSNHPSDYPTLHPVLTTISNHPSDYPTLHPVLTTISNHPSDYPTLHPVLTTVSNHPSDYPTLHPVLTTVSDAGTTRKPGDSGEIHHMPLNTTFDNHQPRNTIKDNNALIYIIIGVLVVFCVIIACIYFYWRRRKLKKQLVGTTNNLSAINPAMGNVHSNINEISDVKLESHLSQSTRTGTQSSTNETAIDVPTKKDLTDEGVARNDFEDMYLQQNEGTNQTKNTPQGTTKGDTLGGDV